MSLVTKVKCWSLAFCTLSVGVVCASAPCDGGCAGHGTCGASGFCACDSAWAGNDCSFFLGTDSDDAEHMISALESGTCLGGCSEQGRCVGGACVCQEGFFGPRCADAECPNACFGHGSCDRGSCACGAGWMGQQCELQAAGASFVESSEGARLVDDSRQEAFQTAQQAAKAVWEVADRLSAAAASENKRDAKRRIQQAIASARQHAGRMPGHEFAPQAASASDVALLSQNAKATACSFGALTCGGHGTCDSSRGKCVCAPSHMGDFCDTKRCPNNCNGSGSCLFGKCVCAPGKFGTSCEHDRCPQDCSGHGYCFNARCSCTGSYGGDSCLLQVHSDHVIRFKVPKNRPLLKGPPLKTSSLRASAAGGTGMQAVSRFRDVAGKQQGCPNSCSSRGQCIKGKCLCFAGFLGSDCSATGARVLAKADSEKATATSLLSKKASGYSAPTLAKSHVRSTPSDAATALDGPMTASWLGRASWIRPASVEPAIIKTEATKALSHDAIAPFDATHTAEQPRSLNKASILTLLSIGSSSRSQQTSGKTGAGWKERALDEGRKPQASLPKNLATLLVTESGVDDMQQETATQSDNLDIDSLLTNI